MEFSISQAVTELTLREDNKYKPISLLLLHPENSPGTTAHSVEIYASNIEISPDMLILVSHHTPQPPTRKPVFNGLYLFRASQVRLFHIVLYLCCPTGLLSNKHTCIRPQSNTVGGSMHIISMQKNELVISNYSWLLIFIKFVLLLPTFDGILVVVFE